MTTTREVRIGDHKFKFIDGLPVVVTAGADEVDHIGLDDVGALAEFAAEAWLALADEEYKPVVISEAGYVADSGVFVKESAHLPFATAFESERDCE